MNKKQVLCVAAIGAASIAVFLLVNRTWHHSDDGPHKITKTQFHWQKPLINSKISSSFGYRTNPVTKKSQFHNGIDLPVPVNSKVLNPYSGIVEDVYFNKEGGNQLRIKHSNGYTSGYAHLSKVLVKKGNKVLQSQNVALSGNTGISTGPHVHFTLRDAHGNYIDPKTEIYS